MSNATASTGNYHADIHDDEKRFMEPSEDYLPSSMKQQLVSSIPRPKGTAQRMEIAFAISDVNKANLGCYKAQFQRIARDAELNNHAIKFLGLDDLIERTFLTDSTQAEILCLLTSIEQNSKPGSDTYVIKLSM
jgi:hypothetical protein